MAATLTPPRGAAGRTELSESENRMTYIIGSALDAAKADEMESRRALAPAYLSGDTRKIFKARRHHADKLRIVHGEMHGLTYCVHCGRTAEIIGRGYPACCN